MKTNKNSEDFLIGKTDAIIGNLVCDKTHLIKAYNYYEGVRDKEQYRYLEENFGLGNPTSLTFTPIGRNHINVLVGEYLAIPIDPRVSCKDKKTISNIMRDKQLKVYNDTQQYLSKHLKNTLLNFIQGNPMIDPLVQFQLDQLKESVENTFISDYEIAAQNIIIYLMQSREVNFKDKLRMMLLDLLITGTCYYTVSADGDTVKFELLDPLNTFVSKNYHSNYAKHGDRAVRRKYLTKAQIVGEYKNRLTQKQINELDDLDFSKYDHTDSYLVRGYSNEAFPNPDPGIQSGYNVRVDSGDPRTLYSRVDLLPVYEVEWIDFDKDGKQQRYETVRIGGDIYLLTGKDEDVIRSVSNPDKCNLTTNGIFFSTRSSKEFSLILATAELQDRYDIVTFLRDSLISNSGSVGDFLDISMLPTFLGNTTAERIKKWLGYKKQGVALINTKDEIMQTADKPMNTIFSGYDDTVKAQAVQALELVLQSIENNFASITGVFRERIGGIEQRDAVSNVQVGITNSFNVTKQYFQQMDIITSEILLDFINNAKKQWRNGVTGSIILGDQLHKVFIAQPKHYTLTDYDIHILSGTETLKEIETIKALVLEFIKAGDLDPDILIDASLSKSLTEMKNKLYKAIKIKKEENNLIEQLSKRAEELQQAVMQLEAQNKELTSRLEKLDEAKLQLEKEQFEAKQEVEWYKARTVRQFNTDTTEIRNKQVDAEYAQLRDGNPRNDEIVNVGF